MSVVEDFFKHEKKYLQEFSQKIDQESEFFKLGEDYKLIDLTELNFTLRSKLSSQTPVPLEQIQESLNLSSPDLSKFLEKFIEEDESYFEINHHHLFHYCDSTLKVPAKKNQSTPEYFYYPIIASSAIIENGNLTVKSSKALSFVILKAIMDQDQDNSIIDQINSLINQNRFSYKEMQDYLLPIFPEAELIKEKYLTYYDSTIIRNYLDAKLIAKDDISKNVYAFSPIISAICGNEGAKKHLQKVFEEDQETSVETNHDLDSSVDQVFQKLQNGASFIINSPSSWSQEKNTQLLDLILNYDPFKFTKKVLLSENYISNQNIKQKLNYLPSDSTAATSHSDSAASSSNPAAPSSNNLKEEIINYSSQTNKKILPYDLSINELFSYVIYYESELDPKEKFKGLLQFPNFDQNNLYKLYEQRSELAQSLDEIQALGLLSKQTMTNPWVGAKIFNDEQAKEIINKLQRLTTQSIPKIIQDIQIIESLDPGNKINNIRKFDEALLQYQSLIDITDTFLPKILEIDLIDYIEATSPHPQKKISYLEKKALNYEVQKLVRKGIIVKDQNEMHEKLKQIKETKDFFISKLGDDIIERIPQNLDEIVNNLKIILSDLLEVEIVLPQDPNSKQLSFLDLDLDMLKAFLDKLLETSEDILKNLDLKNNLLSQTKEVQSVVNFASNLIHQTNKEIPKNFLSSLFYFNLYKSILFELIDQSELESLKNHNISQTISNYEQQPFSIEPQNQITFSSINTFFDEYVAINPRILSQPEIIKETKPYELVIFQDISAFSMAQIWPDLVLGNQVIILNHQDNSQGTKINTDKNSDKSFTKNISEVLPQINLKSDEPYEFKPLKKEELTQISYFGKSVLKFLKKNKYDAKFYQFDTTNNNTISDKIRIKDENYLSQSEFIVVEPKKSKEKIVIQLDTQALTSENISKILQKIPSLLANQGYRVEFLTVVDFLYYPYRLLNIID